MGRACHGQERSLVRVASGSLRQKKKENMRGIFAAARAQSSGGDPASPDGPGIRKGLQRRRENHRPMKQQMATWILALLKQRSGTYIWP